MTELWPPGYTMKECPVCKQKTGTHREPGHGGSDGGVVVYHSHYDSTGKGCEMVGVHAAYRAVEPNPTGDQS